MLKDCPCCGSAARFNTERGVFYELVVKNGSACVSIGCTNVTGCGVTMFCHHNSKDYDKMCEVAEERWNRRAEVETSESL